MTTYAVNEGHHSYRGTDTLIFGIVLAVFTFWLFAQSTLNIAPAIRDSLRITESLSNTAVSISALFSGIFIVVAGGLADPPHVPACRRHHSSSLAMEAAWIVSVAPRGRDCHSIAISRACWARGLRSRLDR